MKSLKTDAVIVIFMVKKRKNHREKWVQNQEI